MVVPCASAHHWIPRKHEMGHNVRTGHAHSKHPINQPLRFEVVYDESIESLSAEKNQLVTEKLIPEAVHYFHYTFSVRPIKIPIKLQRTCKNNAYFLKDETGTKLGDVQYCKEECVTTRCGPVTVPARHLDQCRVCDARGLECVRMPGDEWASGPGITRRDFVLYVSSIQTSHCSVANAVAYASYCQQEHMLDRPVAGFANLCPDRLDTDPRHYSNLISTVKHEVYHALGFSAGLYAFYRDKQGAPLTQRRKHGLPVYNDKTNLYQWSNKVVKKVTRKKWQVRHGHVTHSVSMIVTPRVVRVAREHFNCATLEGAEIENQGGTGTELTHWEKRLFENEAMTGTYTQNPVFSRLTLALMEDTGWYKANYSMAETLDWGRNLGCVFAKESCRTWMQSHVAHNKSSEPFCYTLKQAPLRMRCTHSKLSIALCNLRKYPQPLPPEYQYFSHLPKESSRKTREAVFADTDSYGGAVPLADYCPFYQKFTLTGMDGTKRETTCTVSENGPPAHGNYALESYGATSRCFEQGRPWQAKRGLLTRTMLDWGSGCYRYRCKDGIKIDIGNQTYSCYKAGQRIEVRGVLRNWNVSGSLVCPPCRVFCGDTTGCPMEYTTSELELTLDGSQGSASGLHLSASALILSLLSHALLLSHDLSALSRNI
ncbi:leishmanolysin-like peptidase isoform X2 [Nematostella vectensis]|nr:leishmanolysin-like peptidase isoform X2 [Nematostella vectensis]